MRRSSRHIGRLVVTKSFRSERISLALAWLAGWPEDQSKIIRKKSKPASWKDPVGIFQKRAHPIGFSLVAWLTPDVKVANCRRFEVPVPIIDHFTSLSWHNYSPLHWQTALVVSGQAEQHRPVLFFLIRANWQLSYADNATQTSFKVQISIFNES